MAISPIEQDNGETVPSTRLITARHVSLVLTGNLSVSGWGGVFDYQAVAPRWIVRIVRHYDVLTLNGAATDSARTRDGQPAEQSAPPRTSKTLPDP